MARAEPEGIVSALDNGFDVKGCECGEAGAMNPLILDLITGPLLQLGLELTGQTATKMEQKSVAFIQAAGVPEAAELDLREPKKRTVTL